MPLAHILRRPNHDDQQMVLRIEKVSDGQILTLRLSGRLQSEHLEQLKTHIESEPGKVVLYLGDVKLIDREVVCFLALWEANGVELSPCSPYIRDLIDREKASRPRARRSNQFITCESTIEKRTKTNEICLRNTTHRSQRG